jgi:hypothetical protein
MTKTERMQVYQKYGGRCAYCGREIEHKDMQVDHLIPKGRWYVGPEIESIQNYMPSCRRCNHYKRAHSLETFRGMLLTLHERVRDIYICKVAEDYGIIKVQEWEGVFWFEREDKKDE